MSDDEDDNLTLEELDDYTKFNIATVEPTWLLNDNDDKTKEYSAYKITLISRHGIYDSLDSNLKGCQYVAQILNDANIGHGFGPFVVHPIPARLYTPANFYIEAKSNDKLIRISIRGYSDTTNLDILFGNIFDEKNEIRKKINDVITNIYSINNRTVYPTYRVNEHLKYKIKDEAIEKNKRITQVINRDKISDELEQKGNLPHNVIRDNVFKYLNKELEPNPMKRQNIVNAFKDTRIIGKSRKTNKRKTKKLKTNKRKTRKH